MTATLVRDVGGLVRDPAGDEDGSGRLVVVACRTIGRRFLEAEIRRALALGASHVHLIVPLGEAARSVATACQTPELPACGAPGSLRGPMPAADVVRQGLEWIRGLGATASGEVVARDLVGTIERYVASWNAREVLVAQAPSTLPKLFHNDLPQRLVRRISVPVRTVAPEPSFGAWGRPSSATQLHGGR